ncbi:MAG: hypothetical protein ACC682_17295 [Gemmatimonadota bacterium]
MLERIRVGTAAGLAAGLSVAVMILVYDLVKLEPFATPTLLAGNVLGTPARLDSALGLLASIAAGLKIAYGLAAYTLAHFSVFALVGIGAAFVFSSAVVSGNVVTGGLYGMLVGTAVFYLGLALVAPAFVSVPDWRLVMLTNAVAGVVMVSQIVDRPEPAPDA